MVKKKTLLDQMRANPRGDWTIDDVKALCRRFGLTASPPTGGGSHYRIGSIHSSEILTIPAKRPIKPFYIKSLVVFTDAHRETSEKVLGKKK